MNLDEADASHARKVGIERPNLRILVRRDGCDQHVGETETFSRLSRLFEPAVDTLPCLFRRKEKR